MDHLRLASLERSRKRHGKHLEDIAAQDDEMMAAAGLMSLGATETLLASPQQGMATGNLKPGPEPPKGAAVADFADVAAAAGLGATIVIGGEKSKQYILETTGGGVAMFDYDNDGWLDIFLVNGSRSEGFAKGSEPTNHLYRNNRDGTFSDVTERAGLLRHGWGQGVCVGDYDDDGNLDLFVTYYGKNVLYHNNGDGTFTDVTEKSGLLTADKLYSTGAAFFDYDRDGHLDLFVSHYTTYEDATRFGLGSEAAVTMTACQCFAAHAVCGAPRTRSIVITAMAHLPT